MIRVLIVEDNPADARLIQELLEVAEARYEFEAVPRLADAIALLDRQRYHVVLLDLGLPDSQGMGTLTKLLAHSREVPVIVLTGSKAEWQAMEAARMGAQDYLVKGEVTGEVVERSILYSIERKKAHEEIHAALQTYADVVRMIPSGLITYQYYPPDRLQLIAANPRAEQILGQDLRSKQGKDVDEIWPGTPELRWREALLKVLRTEEVLELDAVPLGKGKVLSVRAFAIPNLRVCVAFEDITDHIQEEELRRQALCQIEENIEHIATLVDEIRNPSQVIIGLAENMEGKQSENIIAQAERIENIVNRLDSAWIASEKLRAFLRRC